MASLTKLPLMGPPMHSYGLRVFVGTRRGGGVDGAGELDEDGLMGAMVALPPSRVLFGEGGPTDKAGNYNSPNCCKISAPMV
jgi:hypothetical protein